LDESNGVFPSRISIQYGKTERIFRTKNICGTRWFVIIKKNDSHTAYLPSAPEQASDA